MQRRPWMRAALQRSEAVLLPALPRMRPERPGPMIARADDPFRPVPTMATEQPLALSTFVRSRGSMAGRSVLRAAGVPGEPFRWRDRPRYAARRSRTMPASRWPRRV